MKKLLSGIIAVAMCVPAMTVSAAATQTQSIAEPIVEINVRARSWDYFQVAQALMEYKTNKTGIECTEENCIINFKPINNTFIGAEIILKDTTDGAVRLVKRAADGIFLQEYIDTEYVVYGNAGNVYTAGELYEEGKLTFEEFKKAGGAYYCDINGNDIVDVNDVTQLQIYLANSKADEDVFATMYYDVTLDSYIDVSDVTKIQMYLAGYENVPCYGHNVVKTGYKEATCISEGYTGDRYCEDCQKVVSKGNTIVINKTNHKNTEIQNEKEATCSTVGYTGDTYCKDCKTLISKGKDIDTEPTNHRWYILKNEIKATTTTQGYSGDKYCFECDAFMEKGKVTDVLPEYIVPDYPGIDDIEQSILKDMNEARKKEGLKPLKWDAELYPAVKIRTNEFILWDETGDPNWYPHNRPNGDSYTDLLNEMGLLYVQDGEILAAATDSERLFPSWMDSPGHRKAILTGVYTHVAICVIKDNTTNTYYACAILRADKLEW